jgi:hypothetical protein
LLDGASNGAKAGTYPILSEISSESDVINGSCVNVSSGIKDGEGVTTGIEGVTTGIEGVTIGIEGVTIGIEGVTTGIEGVTKASGSTGSSLSDVLKDNALLTLSRIPSFFSVSGVVISDIELYIIQYRNIKIIT